MRTIRRGCCLNPYHNHQVDEFLDSVEEAVMGHVNDRVFIMKLSALLQNQTFVALPNTLTVADYASFYLVSLTFVLSLTWRSL